MKKIQHMGKRIVRLSLVLVSVLLLFSACSKKKGFDEDMIVGSWECSDGLHYDFNSDHTGQSGSRKYLPFTWNLDEDELTLRYTGSGEGEAEIVAYDKLIIDDLTASTMKAHDYVTDETVTFKRL